MVDGPEWVKFHQKVRNQGEHQVMYPDEGGFGAFIGGIYDHIDHSNVTVVKGFASIDIVIDKKISVFQTLSSMGLLTPPPYTFGVRRW